MLKHTLIFGFVMSAALAFGQLESNSVTVTASQSVNLQPDQVLFAVYVKGVGITSANFSGVTSAAAGQLSICAGLPPAPTDQWAFGLPVPFAQMKATVTALSSLQQSIAQTNSGFTLSFAVQSAQVSTSLLQSQACNIAGLISDATAQAQKLATAAGLNLGSILAMSSSTSSPVANNSVPVAVLGTFSSIGGTTLQSCALTVKFGLTRF
jgi:uncharacterized protein YggE